MGCAAGSSASQAGEDRSCFTDLYGTDSQLSKGSFGQVYSCRRRDAASSTAVPEEAAVKVIKLDTPWHDFRGRPTSVIDEDLLRKAREEVAVWRMVCGPDGYEHCVGLCASYLQDMTFYMVMERCQKSIMDIFDECQGAPFPDLVRRLRQMLLAIAHVHKQGIVHRDIKPNNFLLGGPDGKTVKLCDFGLAARVPKRQKLKDECGTPAYMSPDMLRGKGYCQKTDVWSLGVTAYVLAFGQLPYVPVEESAKAMKDIILLGHPKPQFLCASVDAAGASVSDVRDVVRALLTRSPEARSTAEDALKRLPQGDPVSIESLTSAESSTSVSTQFGESGGSGSDTPPFASRDSHSQDGARIIESL
jgi:serine/threonine protein kinase